MQFVENNNKKFKNFFLVFLLIYFNTSSLIVTLNFKPEIHSISMSGLILFIFFIYVWKNTKKVNVYFKSIFIVFILCIIIFISMFLNQDNNILNLVIMTEIIVAFIVSNILRFDDFIENYIKIIFFISIYSLIIMYVIRPIFPLILDIFPTKINATGLAVKNYIFTFEFLDASNRNTGIFREMGVYQVFVNIALFMELFLINKKINKKIVIVFIATIISTYSTSGIITLALILLAYVIDNIKDRNKEKIIFILKFLSLLLFIGILVFNFNQSVKKNLQLSMDKLTEKKSSYEGRTTSIKSNLETWSEKPIFGTGRTKGWKIKEEMQEVTEHNTSTTTLFMSMYGFIFAFIITMVFLTLFWRINSNIIVKIILIIGFMISINSQALIHDQLFYIITFCIFMKKNINIKRMVEDSKSIESLRRDNFEKSIINTSS